jgi:hypothetical protein
VVVLDDAAALKWAPKMSATAIRMGFFRDAYTAFLKVDAQRER